jgi:hypothetical protein
MLKYSDLSKGQRKCIDAFVAHHPELATADTLASKDMYHIWHDIFAKRADGAAKIGYPHWLSKHNQISRGILSFPGPSSKGLTTEEMNSLEKSKLQKILDNSEEDGVESISDEEFMAELKANGIEV